MTTKIKATIGFVRDIASTPNIADAITLAKDVNVFTPEHIEIDIYPPTLSSWELDLNTKELTLEFSENIKTLDLTKLSISGRNGDHVLTTTSPTLSTPLSNTVNITLTDADRDAIRSVTANETPAYLSGAPSWGTDESDNIGLEFSNIGAFIFIGIPDTTAPTLSSWSLNLNTKVLTLTLTESDSTISRSSFKPQYLTFVNGSNTVSLTETRSNRINKLTNTTGSTWVAEVSIITSDRNNLANLYNARVIGAYPSTPITGSLTTAAGWISDTAATANLAEAITTAITGDVIQLPDIITPRPSTWSLDLSASTLTLNLNENIKALDLTKLSISGSGGSHTLTTTTTVGTPANTFTISLNNADVTGITAALRNRLPVFLNGNVTRTPSESWSIDEADNKALAFRNFAPTTFAELPDTTVPTLLNWSIDLANDTARFTISEAFQNFETTKITISGISIPTTTHTFTADLSGNTIGNTFAIDLPAAAVTALASLTDAQLSATAGWVQDRADTPNSAAAISDVASISFTPRPDVIPPTLQSWSLNMDEGSAEFLFDKTMNINSAMPEKMIIAGINGQYDLENTEVVNPNINSNILKLTWNNDVNDNIVNTVNDAFPISLLASKSFINDSSENPHPEIIVQGTNANDMNALGIGLKLGDITVRGTQSIIPSPTLIIGGEAIDNAGNRIQGSSVQAKDSPNVQALSGLAAEITSPDLTQIISSVSTSKAVFIGEFSWGPSDEVINISSKQELAEKFGFPVGNYIRDWNTASNFLDYENKSLDIVRVLDNDSNTNLTNIPSAEATDVNNFISAKYKGLVGNSIGALVLVGPDHFAEDASKLFNGHIDPVEIFDTAPAADEMHIIIYDADGKITNNAGTILETYAYLSTNISALNADRNTNYYKNVLESKSNYIKAGQNLITTNILVNESLTNGLDATYNTNSINMVTELSGKTQSIDASGVDALFIQAQLAFQDSELSDAGIFICGDRSITVQKFLHDLVVNKGDAVAVFSPSFAASVSNPSAAKVLDHFSTFNSSSYSIFTSGWKTVLDTFTNSYIQIPLDSDVAALLAQTDARNNAWWSPAGYNRGLIKNARSISFNPTSAERDNLYTNRVNPIVASAGVGVLLYGDKTALSRPSGFDRINVRRLFNVLKKAVAESARYQLFEFNDEYTRANFQTVVEQFLGIIKADRGITDFRVVVKDDANTVDSNSFIADIYIKPNRSISFVQLNFIAVNTGVDFNEIIDA